ncbi:fasciclin domain-containing protein [Sphingobacterium faecium]|uniref:fasciclin domain-containing protein n=1 Tax=Sphingobacterium faecium TaxID=34087 RepID=UPI0021B68153|nr:fasciclin domain-containing protein [Sphingobacterium faecium]UXD67983.1 fasciclin domain-containing protein [Sphingobacterium faecium]
MKLQLRYYKQLGILLFATFMVTSCKKDEVLNNHDNNRVNLVIADNFNLSSFSAVLRKSGMDKVLQDGEGPYTLLAPSDAAFSAAGYGDAVSVLAGNTKVISRIAHYHMLDGKYELNKLPFLFNQELRTRGGKMYATHWLKGGDTVLTLNGSRVLAQNISASNGLIQVLDRVLTPYVHDLIGNAIAADPSITLFAQALKTSGVLQTISDAGPYTVFAPNNAAMQALGYSTVQQILLADPVKLRSFLLYHIVKDRRFVYDYILSTGASNKAQQGMMDGNSITISLVSNPNAPNSFQGISLRGIGNTSEIKLLKQDMLSGNGVLHVIDGGLRITQ